MTQYLECCLRTWLLLGWKVTRGDESAGAASQLALPALLKRDSTFSGSRRDKTNFKIYKINICALLTCLLMCPSR